MRFLRFLIVLIVAVVGLHKARAQQNDPDEFLDDDEPFDEQTDVNAQRGAGPRTRGPQTPYRPPPPPINSSPSTPSIEGPDEIAFHLVDPPKYWKPKKRFHRSAKAQKAADKAAAADDAKAAAKEKE